MSVLGLPLALPLVAASGVYLLSGATKKKHSSSDSETRRRRRERRRKEEKKTKKFFGLDLGKKRTYKSARFIKRSERILDTQKAEETSKLVVYYKPRGSRDWDYSGLPSSWTYEKSDSTSEPGYRKKAIFKGKHKYRAEALRYLDGLFQKLKNRDKVDRYKVRRTD